MFAASIANTHLRNNDNSVVSGISSHVRTAEIAVDTTRPHFVIHIGPHKTGTTCLQDAVLATWITTTT